MSANELPDPIRSPDEDAGAFVQLLLEHEPSVRAFLRGLLPSWNDVDEVIQEASLVAWRKYGEFEKGTAFGGWLLTIARYEALAHRRRLAKSQLVFSDDVWEAVADDLVDETLEDESPQMYRSYLESCLSRLRPEQRALLLKVHSPRTVIREVAAKSGKSEQAFYKTIQRLRTTLVKCISQSVAEEETA